MNACTKIPYSTRAQARAAIRALNTGQTRARRGPHPEKTLYRCDLCGNWHTSSQTGHSSTLKKPDQAPPPIRMDAEDDLADRYFE